MASCCWSLLTSCRILVTLLNILLAVVAGGVVVVGDESASRFADELLKRLLMRGLSVFVRGVFL